MPTSQFGIPGLQFGTEVRFKEITSAGYTVVEDDMLGNVCLLLNHASAQNLTIPASLVFQEPLTVINYGAGLWTFLASSTTLNSKGSFLRLSEQYSAASMWPDPLAADTYLIVGDLA